MNEEVLREASQKCKTCRGKGWFTTWKLVDPETQKLSGQICGCAVRRFKKKFGDEKVLRREDGSMYWREDILVVEHMGQNLEVPHPILTAVR